MLTQLTPAIKYSSGYSTQNSQQSPFGLKPKRPPGNTKILSVKHLIPKHTY